MDGGAVDRESINNLTNSISRFVHLIACQTTKSTFAKEFRDLVPLLKLLKAVLDESLGSEIPTDEQLTKAAEELDIVVNEAREILEKQPPKMSKICSVLQTEPVLLKVKKFSLEICNSLSRLQQSSSFSPPSNGVQLCMEELQYPEQVLTSELIENALKDQMDNIMPCLNDVIKITKTLGLTSTQELLMESIALEKERMRSELKKKIEDADRIYKISGLVNHIRHCLGKMEQFGFLSGLPIPSYFRCPLSLELMLDPVIVASGQTYERSFIQKWLDNGLRICPNTRQPLDHINLIPNFTVKALIANWCEENNIKLYDFVKVKSNSHLFLSQVAVENLCSGICYHDSVHGDSCLLSSSDCANQMEAQKGEVYSECGGEPPFLVSHHQTTSSNEISQHNTKTDQQSYCHSKSESISSTISSIDISSKFDEKASLSGEVACNSTFPSSKDCRSSPWFSSDQLCSSRTGHTNNVSVRGHSSVPGVASDGLITMPHVQKLVEDLQDRTPEVQATAASELRLLAKHDMENRVLIAKYGAIGPLISLLYSKVNKVQENSVTALLNLSINENNKVLIADAGAIEPLIHVLECGNMEARENSAATLFSLSALEENKAMIGRSGAVKALVDLLALGSMRGKKDAATALFSLSIVHENKARMVKAGAVKYLVELLDPSTGMVDKSLALLANLAMIPEGRSAIVQEGGIPLLVETMETGSQRGKENAASVLFQLCINSKKFCSLVLQEGAVPPLIALSQFGTSRAKEKAQQILSHLRSQREGATGRVKS